MNKIVSRLLLSAALFAIAFCFNNESRAQYSSSNPFRIPLTNSCTLSGPGLSGGFPTTGYPDPPYVPATIWYDIGDWQIFLIESNVLVDGQPLPSNYPTNTFTPLTVSFTEAWQKANGVPQSGKVDQATFNASGLSNPQVTGPPYANAATATAKKSNPRDTPPTPSKVWFRTVFDADFREGMGYNATNRGQSHGPRTPDTDIHKKKIAGKFGGRGDFQHHVHWDDVLQWQDFLMRCYGIDEPSVLDDLHPFPGWTSDNDLDHPPALNPRWTYYPHGTFDEATEAATKKFQACDKYTFIKDMPNHGVLPQTGRVDACTLQKAMEVIYHHSVEKIDDKGSVKPPLTYPPPAPLGCQAAGGN